jgi:hypothetical protein
MPAGLALQEEPFPWRGLNDAVSPVNLEPGYTPEAHDLVLDEPGALRPRFGWKRGQAFTAIDLSFAREVPVGYMRDSFSSGYGALHTYVHQDTDTPASGTFTSRYFDNADLYARGYATGLTGTTAPSAMPTDTHTTNLLPIGHPHWYLDRQFALSVGNNFVRFMGFSATATVTGRHAISLWGGNGNTVQTRTLTMNNGSASGTLSSTLTGSAPRMYMIVTDITAGEVAGHKYVYEVYSVGGTTLTLTQPYGLGDAAADVPNIAGKSVTFYPIGYIPNAPDADAMAVWRDRLWCVGGTLNSPPATTSPLIQAENILCWSNPADYNRWPAANYIQLDDNEAVRAMAATSEALFLFSANRTQVVTGTDESNFQLVTLYEDLGCVHSGACYSDGNAVYVMAADGVFRLTLGARDELTRPDTTTGVANTFRQFFANSSSYDSGFQSDAVPWVFVDRGTLFLTMDRVLGPTADATYSADTRPLPLSYNLRTGAWSTWGRTTTRYNTPTMFYTRTDTPSGSTSRDRRLWAAGRTGLFYMEHCWDAEYLGASLTNPFVDEFYNSSGGSTSANVEAAFTTRDFMFADGRTTRLQSVHVEHACQASVSSVLPWTVTLDTDQDIDSSTLSIGTVHARVNNPGARAKYYTDNFTDVSFPTEGMVFRIRFAFTGTNVTSGKLYRQRFNVLRAPTKDGRVDNS